MYVQLHITKHSMIVDIFFHIPINPPLQQNDCPNLRTPFVLCVFIGDWALQHKLPYIYRESYPHQARIDNRNHCSPSLNHKCLTEKEVPKRQEKGLSFLYSRALSTQGALSHKKGRKGCILEKNLRAGCF